MVEPIQASAGDEGKVTRDLRAEGGMTLGIVKRYVNDRDKELATRASQTVKQLEQRIQRTKEREEKAAKMAKEREATASKMKAKEAAAAKAAKTPEPATP